MFRNTWNVQKYVLLLGLPVLLSACVVTDGVSKRDQVPLARTFDTSDGSSLKFAKNPSLLVRNSQFKVGDIADVVVHGVEDFSGTYSVDKTGRIHFVHIGQIHVAGLNITQLQDQLRAGYGACCLKDPSVSVTKEAQELGRIVVDGAVEKPGVFEINELVHLSEAIALAGGATLEANTKEVVIARLFENERRIMSVNLRDIQVRGANDPLIYPTDVVFIQDSTKRILFNDFVRTLPLLNSFILLSRN